MKIIFFCLYLLMSVEAHSEVQIKTYKKAYSWKSDWTQAITDELKKDQYRAGPNAFLSIELDEEDLDELSCDGYNSASMDEKSDFWVVFFSALTRAESAFNEKSKTHRNFGLLQLAPVTAKTQCGIIPPEHSVLNAADNLKCGITLMKWQLLGAPTGNGKKIRSDLEGQLFGKYMFQWGPLRQNDSRGRALLTNWFNDHLDQLKFCQKK